MLALIALAACAVPDKHQNFVDVMNSLVGQRADERRGMQFGRIQEAKEIRELADGTIEYVMDHVHSLG
jgi:hypothetical protein